jgi:hypothetical protein
VPHPAWQVLTQVAGQVASQVGQPGQVHAVGQVHCSAYTVPLAWLAGLVSKLSTDRSSSFSVSLLRMRTSGWCWPFLRIVRRTRRHGPRSSEGDHTPFAFYAQQRYWPQAVCRHDAGQQSDS